METVLKILGCIVLITLWVLWNWFTHWFETEWNKPSNTDIEEEEKKWLNKYSDQLAVHSVIILSKWMNENNEIIPKFYHYRLTYISYYE